MDPRVFLLEECDSVERALKETLRHDYGPDRSSAYYEECSGRLRAIRGFISDQDLDPESIATHLQDLSFIGSRVSLIERSHLGEFSWPFAQTVQAVAETLFAEKDISGNLCEPIVHVIAEGIGYQIVNETVPLSGEKRIVVVAFPRQLRHHVLLHSIFGHELGHLAYQSVSTGKIISAIVGNELAGGGPLGGVDEMTAWVNDDRAPKSIKRELARRPKYVFSESALSNWRTEIICDLFGLLLFGPPFAAAHRALLEPLNPGPLYFQLDSSTHPPYEIRRRVIAQAVKVLGWDVPVTPHADDLIYEAESKLIAYITEVKPGDWPTILTDEAIASVLGRLAGIFNGNELLAFARPDPSQVAGLVNRLAVARPPIIQHLDEAGIPTCDPVSTSNCLYAGWTYWFGREAFHSKFSEGTLGLPELDFLSINKLCDLALIQQSAINYYSRN